MWYSCQTCNILVMWYPCQTWYLCHTCDILVTRDILVRHHVISLLCDIPVMWYPCCTRQMTMTPFSVFRRKWILSMQWLYTMRSPRFSPHPVTACLSTTPTIVIPPLPCSPGGWGRPPEVSRSKGVIVYQSKKTQVMLHFSAMITTFIIHMNQQWKHFISFF